jgi:hypothetical protein
MNYNFTLYVLWWLSRTVREEYHFLMFLVITGNLLYLNVCLSMQEFGFVHLSAGDLLREERNKEGSQYGELIEQTIRDGKIVPVEITCSLIEMV